MMTTQTAKVFVDFCVNFFEKINTVVFFGGEPMLNVDVMEFICKQFKAYYQTGKSPYLPQFGIITNGTILTPKILRFLKEHISLITVSIDGPQEINDVNRIYKNGKGSYIKIAQFIKTILAETNILIQYESTYTQSHIDMQYKRKDIIKALQNEFGIEGMIVDEKNLDSNQILDSWETVDYADLAKDDFVDMPVGFWEILRAIVQKKAVEICPLVKGIFAVGAEGSIYPCHMLNGLNKLNLGNIQGANIFSSPSLYESCCSHFQFKNGDKCKQCWAQNLCGGCAIQKFYNEETEEFSMNPNTEMCKFTQQHLEQILLMIATIRKNPSIWAALIDKSTRR
jgi:uncharacterized protein